MLVKSHQEISFLVCWNICVSRGLFWKWRLMCLWVESSLSLPDRNSHSNEPRDRSGKEQNQLADGNGVEITTVDPHAWREAVCPGTQTQGPQGWEQSPFHATASGTHISRDILCFEMALESEQKLTQNNPHTQTHCHQDTHLKRAEPPRMPRVPEKKLFLETPSQRDRPRSTPMQTQNTRSSGLGG